MVRSEQIGRTRSFWVGFLLTLVTFGLYSIYWNYRVHDEVYRQFDLEDDHRDEGIPLLIYGIALFALFPVGAILLLLYQRGFIHNVNYVRTRMTLGPGVGVAEFVLWNTVGWLLPIIGPAIGYYRLQSTVNELWEEFAKRSALLRAPAAVPSATAATPPPALPR